MKVALIWPKSTFLTDPMVYPPLGLWYIWSALEDAGHEAAYRDTSMDEYKTIPECDYYFVSGTSAQLMEIRNILRWIKKHRKGKTVLGGSHALTQTDKHLSSLGFDLVFKGEINNKEDLKKILEAKPSEKIIYSRFSRDLSKLIKPCRKSAWRYRAFLEDKSGKKHPTATLFTSRGCPNRCAFCESGIGRMWGSKIRFNPVETVIEELEECYSMGFTGIMFYDDILPINKKRTLKIIEVMQKYHKEIGAVWRCFLRTDILIKQGGFEYLRRMKKSGLVEVLVGVESASNKIKANVQKGTTIEQDTKVLKWCKKLGIKFKASLILGLPGETMETMGKTRKWIFENKPDRVDIGTYIPFPGTPITTDMAILDGKYDIYLDMNHADKTQGDIRMPETFWYKGPRDRSICLVGTSNLSPKQIGDYRNKLIKEIIKAGIPY